MSAKRLHPSLFPGLSDSERIPVHSRLGYPAPQNGKRRKMVHDRLNGGSGQGPRDARDLIRAHRAASPSFYQQQGPAYPLAESLLDLDEPPLPYQYQGPGVGSGALVVDNVESLERHRAIQRSVALATRRFPLDDLRNELMNKRRFQDNPQDLRSRLCRMQSERQTPPGEDDMTVDNYSSQPPTLRISIRNEPEMVVGPGPVLSARMQGRLSARQPRIVLTEEESSREADFSDFEAPEPPLPASLVPGHSRKKRASEPRSPTCPAPPIPSGRRSSRHSRRSDERRPESPRQRDTRSRGRRSLSRKKLSSPVRAPKNSLGSRSVAALDSSYSRRSLDRMWRAEKESSRFGRRGEKVRSPSRRGGAVERKPRYASRERRDYRRSQPRRRSPAGLARRHEEWKSRRSRSRSRSGRRGVSPEPRRHRRRSTPVQRPRHTRPRTRSPTPRIPDRQRKPPTPDQSFHSGTSCYDFELLGSQHDGQSVSGSVHSPAERIFDEEVDTGGVTPGRNVDYKTDLVRNGSAAPLSAYSSDFAVLNLSTARREVVPTVNALDLSSSGRHFSQRLLLPVAEQMAMNGIQKHALSDGKPTKSAISSDVFAVTPLSTARVDPYGGTPRSKTHSALAPAARGQQLLQTAQSPPAESILPTDGAATVQPKAKTNPPPIRFSQLKNRGSLLVVPVMQESVEQVAVAVEAVSNPSRFAFKKQDRKSTKATDFVIDATLGNTAAASSPWVLTATIRNDCSYAAMPNDTFPENYRLEDPRWLSRRQDFLKAARTVKEVPVDAAPSQQRDQQASETADIRIKREGLDSEEGKLAAGVKVEPAE